MKKNLFFLSIALFLSATFMAQTITIDPDEGGQGEDLKVTISGENTVWNQATSCFIQATNVLFMQGTATAFIPDVVEVLAPDTLCAWLAIPEDAEVNLYDVLVGANLSCPTPCLDCFEVVEAPELIGDPQNSMGQQGGAASIILGIANGSYEDCDLNTENVYLELNGNFIYPSSVELLDGELVVNFDLPEDAAPGAYNLIVGEGQSYGCNFVCEACFEVMEIIATEDLPDTAWEVFPNPFESEFRVVAPNLLNDVTIRVYDVTGKLMHTEKQDAFNATLIDLSHLPKGVYNLKLTANEGEAVRQLVKF